MPKLKDFGKVGLDLTHTDCEETVGLRIDEVVKMWYQKKPWQNTTCEEVTIDIVNILIDEIKENGKALPGVIDALEMCQKADLKIGLATSSYHNIIEAVLDKLGIRQYFDAIHSAEYEKLGKPHPAVFLTAAEKLSVNPQDCLVIEDSLNGVIAAKAARMKVIAVPEQSHAYNPKLSLSDNIIKSLETFDLVEAQKLFET